MTDSFSAAGDDSSAAFFCALGRFVTFPHSEFSEVNISCQMLLFPLPRGRCSGGCWRSRCLLQYVYQAVDMVVVGQVVGPVGLVSISNATNAAYIVNAFVIGLTAGGGVVSATVTGKRELKALEIDPEAVDPDDVEMLQDMIVAAVNEAMRAADSDAASTMQSITGGLGLPF